MALTSLRRIYFIGAGRMRRSATCRCSFYTCRPAFFGVDGLAPHRCPCRSQEPVTTAASPWTMTVRSPISFVAHWVFLMRASTSIPGRTETGSKTSAESILVTPFESRGTR